MTAFTDTFHLMTEDEATATVNALTARLDALPANNVDQVDRATRAGVKGLVMGYRASHT